MEDKLTQLEAIRRYTGKTRARVPGHIDISYVQNQSAVQGDIRRNYYRQLDLLKREVKNANNQL